VVAAGPVLFVLYTANLISLIESHRLSPHLYAVEELSASIYECTAAVTSWMRSNRLNADKTEVLWSTTGRRQHQLLSGTLTNDGRPTAVSASSSVRGLRIHIDANLVMRTHVQKTVSYCFAVLHKPREIRRSVPQPTFQSLMVTLVN